MDDLVTRSRTYFSNHLSRNYHQRSEDWHRTALDAGLPHPEDAGVNRILQEPERHCLTSDKSSM